MDDFPAPHDGFVITHLIEVGQFVQPGPRC